METTICICRGPSKGYIEIQRTERDVPVVYGTHIGSRGILGFMDIIPIVKNHVAGEHGTGSGCSRSF